MNPRALIISGAGLNCEGESAAALQHAGFDAHIIHIIDLSADPAMLDEASLLLFPGGFSYGDHLGAAFVLAEEMRRLEEPLARFVEAGKLIIGICNGCQLLLRLGLLGGSNWRFLENSPAHQQGHYQCRWVHVCARLDTPYFRKGELFFMPVAHGEGRLIGGAEDEIALQYARADGSPACGQWPDNPNGAAQDAAAIAAHKGRVLAIMPHPERAIFNWQRPDFTKMREETRRAGQEFNADAPTPTARIFRNARGAF